MSPLNTTGNALVPGNNPNSTGLTTGQQALPNAPTNVSFPVVLPNIPNPVPPPPKTLAVVTPDGAQKDLATKKDATMQVDTAMQQQMQRTLSQQTQPTQTDQQQQKPTDQPQAPATAPANSTPQQILQLLNSGNVSLTREQVQAISGLDFTGFQMNPDGTFTADPSAVKRVDDANGYNTNTATGDPSSDYIMQQLQQNQTQADADSATHQQQLNQILNGTFPLTVDQQAQVADLQSQFAQLRQMQEQANANFVGATTVLGIRSGRSQYAPEIASGQITNAVNQGITKLANLDSQAASAVAKLKQGFLDNDYKIINQSYEDLQTAQKAKTDTLTQIQNTIKNQLQATTERLQQQKAQLDIQTAQVSNLAASTLAASMGIDGTLDLDAIQKIADDNGIDPNVLYGAVLKEQHIETVQQQQDSKFASDQLQATANLANTKATTANTQATTAKTNADVAATKATTVAADEASALGNQAGYKKLAPAQKTIVDGTNNLINALKEYRDLYKDKTDKSGGNYFGEDAAQLASAYHSLIFQFSVAAGSGAIQKADAEQIEQIIPDPTSISGIAKAAVKGGQSGGLKALDTQINKFTNSLKTYGITPTDTSNTESGVVPNPNGGEDIQITD